jgi:GcrA cell cycle regulator
MSWSDERVEKLKKMWAEGQSASQIAKELGGVTRNAVIGKVHRLGLSNRNGSGGAAAAKSAEGAKAKQPAKSRAKAKPTKAAKPEAEPAPAKTEAPAAAEEAPTAAPVSRARQIIPAGQPLPPQPSANEIDPAALAKVSEIEKKAKKLTLMELTERTCKWPVGDPATDDFWFCGLPVQAGKPYCEAHVGVAFQPMSSRRDRRR